MHYHIPGKFKVMKIAEKIKRSLEAKNAYFDLPRLNENFEGKIGSTSIN